MKDYKCEVSIIIPVKNEEKYIGKCLESILKQTYFNSIKEVIIVDGISTDRTLEIIKKYSGKINIVVLEDQKKQRASGMNAGIKASQGDIIIRIDARSVIPYNYVEDCVKTLIEKRADNVGGVQKPLANSIKQEAIGITLSNTFGIGNAQFRIGKKSGFVDTVYLGCFQKKIFESVGLFDEKSMVISEDSDMNQRIREAGGKVYLNKDIIVGYYPRDKFKDLIRLYFRYGGARAGNLLKSKKLTSSRQLVAPLFVLILISGMILSFFKSFFFFLWLSVVGIYLITDFIVSLYLSVRNKKVVLIPLLFISFPCLHIPWGLGFIVRLIQRTKSGQYWQ